MQSTADLLLQAISAAEEAVTALHQLSNVLEEGDVTTAVMAHDEATLMRDRWVGAVASYGQMYWQQPSASGAHKAGYACVGA